MKIEENRVIRFHYTVSEAGREVESSRAGEPLAVLFGRGGLIAGSVVDVDLNHPMAGKTLRFDLEIIDVREASAQELEHGHVHGPGGVEHD
jgi:FKBP-type peptidyl-prolyl cis-trans isomerase SlyD